MNRVNHIPIFCLFPVLGLVTVQAGLVGHWKFDEGTGTNYVDSSPNANNAYHRSGGQLWSADVPVTGFANTASIDFDGLGSYVSTPFTGIGGSSPRTIACWIKTTHTSEHGIVAWGLSTSNGAKWHFRINSNAANGPLGALRSETQGDFTIGSTIVSDGTWHHVACVYPGGGEVGTVQHYVDGVLETAGGNGASTQAVNTSTAAAPVTIGRRTQGTNIQYFDGGIDEVRIYDRALSAPEIAGLTGAAPTSDGLLLYMPFEEGSGSLIDDLGSGDNDGVLNGDMSVPPTWSTDAPPHLAGSLRFADAGDILFTDYPGIGGSASRSVTFWFKTTMAAADNGIVAWGNSNLDGLKWHARLNATTVDGPLGALRLEIQGARAVATTSVADGQWHHAAIVFQEDADPDVTDIVFYLDGEIDPISQSLSVPIDTQTEGAGALPVTLGGRYQGSTLRGFDGNLADIRIYDTGLSQAEVQTIMSGAEGPRLQLDINREAGGDLNISWESQEGMLYSLRSDTDLSEVPLDKWPVFGGLENLEATPPRNSVSFPMPIDEERFFVVEEIPPPPVPIFTEDFESGALGWTTGSDDQPGTVWELGTPVGAGPAAANSRVNCFGTNLSGPYTLDANVWLRSPAIDLTTAAGATLNYHRWIDIEEMFDFGRVAVLDAGDGSELAVLDFPLDGISVDWELVSKRIPAAALGKLVVIEFRLDTDNIDGVAFAGFYIDDVVVTVP